MRGRIDIIDLIHKEYKTQKESVEELRGLEKKLFETLSSEQKLLFENIILQNNYERNFEDKELIKFVLDFVSSFFNYTFVPSRKREKDRGIFFD